ncbi:MAG: hypothetical protein PUF97_04525 [Bifidobacteriaceae bacterium]|nr:hypothetical protein [Bifidobacteriaceae bacterium]
MAECDEDPSLSLPACSLAPVVAYFLSKKDGLVVRAYQGFLRMVGVNPHGRARCLQEIDAIHDAFFDWFAYDYHFPDGTTPLERYLYDNVSGRNPLPKNRARALWTVLNCTVEGAFLVTTVSPYAGVVVVQSLADGTEYAIADREMMMSLMGCENTLICVRITQFGRTWQATSRAFHISTRTRRVATGPLGIDLEQSMMAERLARRSGRRQSCNKPATDKRVGSLLEGVPDALVPEPVNSISLEWFMSGDEFDVESFMTAQEMKESYGYALPPLSACRDKHGRTWEIASATLGGMPIVKLLRLVFCEPDDPEYDPEGYGSRDYLMLCRMLADLGVMM